MSRAHFTVLSDLPRLTAEERDELTPMVFGYQYTRLRDLGPGVHPLPNKLLRRVFGHSYGSVPIAAMMRDMGERGLLTITAVPKPGWKKPVYKVTLHDIDGLMEDTPIIAVGDPSTYVRQLVSDFCIRYHKRTGQDYIATQKDYANATRLVRQYGIITLTKFVTRFFRLGYEHGDEYTFTAFYIEVPKMVSSDVEDDRLVQERAVGERRAAARDAGAGNLSDEAFAARMEKARRDAEEIREIQRRKKEREEN